MLQVPPLVTTAPTAERFPVYHEQGRRACGALVCFFARRIMLGEIIQASDVIVPDGRPGQHGERIYCPGCGGALAPMGDNGRYWVESQPVSSDGR